MIKRLKKSRGTSDFTVIAMILGALVAVSVAYFVMNWIISIKESRSKSNEKVEQPPPPKSVEDMGGYEITY